MKKFLPFAAALAATAVMGCGQIHVIEGLSEEDVEPPKSKPAQETPAQTGNQVTRKATTANNEFGIAFLGNVATSGQNVMISPVSLTLALGMAASGANGETLKSMEQALHISGEPYQRWQMGHHELWRLLKESGQTVEFSLANAIWVGKNMPVETSFLDVAKQVYQSSSRSIDFGSPKAADEINSWVAGQTNNRIQNLVKSTDALTLMMIVNAISFKAKWKSPFEKESTHDAPFFTAPGSSKPTKMMHQESGFTYGNVDGNQILKMPYQGDKFDMVMVLPKKGTDIADFAKGITQSTWGTWIASGKSESVSVTIPKWQSEATINAKDALTAMGMGIAFDPDRADFSKLTKMPAFIDSVTHKSFIKVDEEGTEAAAATAVEIKVTSALPNQPKVFRADRPFLYAICDSSNGTIVFLGIVSDPTK